MKICKPLDAREWFSRKVRTNWIITAVVFALLLVALTQICDWWVAVFGSGAAAFALFFFYLDHRSVGVECSNCERIIESDTPWICGFKQCRNENTKTFPFIHKCEHCGFSPKGYECHHCGQLVFLSKDRQKFQFAKALVVPKRIETKASAGSIDAVTRIAKQQQERFELQHQLELTRLQSDIAVEKARGAKIEEKTLRNQYEQELETLYGEAMGRENAAERIKSAIRKKYAGEELEIERRCSMVDKITMERL